MVENCRKMFKNWFFCIIPGIPGIPKNEQNIHMKMNKSVSEYCTSSGTKKYLAIFQTIQRISTTITQKLEIAKIGKSVFHSIRHIANLGNFWGGGGVCISLTRTGPLFLYSNPLLKFHYRPDLARPRCSLKAYISDSILDIIRFLKFDWTVRI